MVPSMSSSVPPAIPLSSPPTGGGSSSGYRNLARKARPGSAMRAAIAEAVVGDDLATGKIRRSSLQEQVAALLDKRGGACSIGHDGQSAGPAPAHSACDDVLVSEGAHIKWYEAGERRGAVWPAARYRGGSRGRGTVFGG